MIPVGNGTASVDADAVFNADDVLTNVGATGLPSGRSGAPERP